MLAVGTEFWRDRLLLRARRRRAAVRRLARAHRHRRRAAAPPAAAAHRPARRRGRHARRDRRRPRRARARAHAGADARGGAARRPPLVARRRARTCRSWHALDARSCPTTASSSPTRPSRPTSRTTPGPGAAPRATSRPAASARSARRCRWRSARRSRRPAARWSALAGDGGVLFTIQELASAADLGAAHRARDLAERRLRRDARLDGPHQRAARRHRISAHDFVQLAEGFGCRGVRTESLDDLPGALAEAFAADRPTLVEVHSWQLGSHPGFGRGPRRTGA